MSNAYDTSIVSNVRIDKVSQFFKKAMTVVRKHNVIGWVMGSIDLWCISDLKGRIKWAIDSSWLRFGSNALTSPLLSIKRFFCNFLAQEIEKILSECVKKMKQKYDICFDFIQLDFLWESDRAKCLSFNMILKDLANTRDFKCLREIKTVLVEKQPFNQ